MSTARRLLGARGGRALWSLAAGLLVHAALREVTGEADPLAAIVVGFLVGALPLVAGWRAGGHGGAAVEIAGGGVVTALAALLATLALPPLRDALGGDLPVAAILVLGVGIAALVRGGTAGRVGVLVGVEWLKARKGRLLRTGLLVTGGATLLASWTHAPIREETTGWTQAASSLGTGFWTAEIFLLVLGATAVAGEVGQGTMKMLLPHAYRRAEWVVAKALVLLGAAVLFAVVPCVVGIGHTWMDAGLGDVTRTAPAGFGMEDTVEVFETADIMRGRLMETIAASTASLAASALLGLLLSCIFTGLVSALSASFLVFAALKTGDTFLGLSRQAVQAIYAHYPGELRRLTEQFGRAVNDSWNEALLPTALDLAFLTAALALLVSLRLFGRRDLHG